MKCVAKEAQQLERASPFSCIASAAARVFEPEELESAPPRTQAGMCLDWAVPY